MDDIMFNEEPPFVGGLTFGSFEEFDRLLTKFVLDYPNNNSLELILFGKNHSGYSIVVDKNLNMMLYAGIEWPIDLYWREFACAYPAKTVFQCTRSNALDKMSVIQLARTQRQKYTEMAEQRRQQAPPPQPPPRPPPSRRSSTPSSLTPSPPPQQPRGPNGVPRAGPRRGTPVPPPRRSSSSSSSSSRTWSSSSSSSSSSPGPSPAPSSQLRLRPAGRLVYQIGAGLVPYGSASPTPSPQPAQQPAPPPQCDASTQTDAPAAAPREIPLRQSYRRAHPINYRTERNICAVIGTFEKEQHFRQLCMQLAAWRRPPPLMSLQIPPPPLMALPAPRAASPMEISPTTTPPPPPGPPAAAPPIRAPTLQQPGPSAAATATATSIRAKEVIAAIQLATQQMQEKRRQREYEEAVEAAIEKLCGPEYARRGIGNAAGAQRGAAPAAGAPNRARAVPAGAHTAQPANATQMGTAPAAGAQAQPADTLDVRLQQTTGIRLRGMEIEVTAVVNRTDEQEDAIIFMGTQRLTTKRPRQAQPQQKVHKLLLEERIQKARAADAGEAEDGTESDDDDYKPGRPGPSQKKKKK